jgi:hypothetical protein
MPKTTKTSAGRGVSVAGARRPGCVTALIA